ncbi:hypothetical protein QBC42DRAFT_298555 [Cladorrhinum samala]|uniref:Uncharacterized protein n=1 Tax=Cladorrhinum samala TaxID=585594 RepID=A0AAV9HM53_9PEZI|nr:hypothetical protein QBC42DRAFT_298555 [Cladorrhinum samala]
MRLRESDSDPQRAIGIPVARSSIDDPSLSAPGSNLNGTSAATNRKTSERPVDSTASMDTPLPSVELPNNAFTFRPDMQGPRTESEDDASDLGGIQEGMQRLRHDSVPRDVSTPKSSPGRSVSPSQRPRTPTSNSRAGTEALLVSQYENLNLHPDDTPGRERKHRRGRRSVSVNHDAPPHNITDEDSPDDPFHDPGFQQKFSNARAQMAKVADVLRRGLVSPEETPAIHRLHRRAQDLANYQPAATRTVAFVGDSGVGKSSVLNSLLDVKGLARASSGGSACTCVATEYRYQGHEGFSIEVTYFTEDELETQLSELVHSSRLYLLHKDTLHKGEELRDAEARYKLATDTFEAMFRGRMRNSNFVTAEAENEVVKTMMGWARELGPVADSRRHVFTDSEACSSLLSELCSEVRGSKKAASWPYTKKISVYLDAHVLRSGLVLVDLPGLRDLNSARQKITERYLVKCDEIFVLCDSGRATTDAGVMAVFKLAKRAGLSNVGIICTKSDAIVGRVDEALMDCVGGEAEAIANRVETIKSAERDLQGLRTAREEIVEDLKEFYDEDTIKEFHDVERKIKTKEAFLETLRLELRQYLVNTRNARVISKLRTTYQHAVPDSELNVFCVSNSFYWDNRHLPKDKSLPHLELSGIIALRRHCASLVSQRQLWLAKSYIREKIPTLINEVELWIQAGSASAEEEEKRRIVQAINDIESNLRKCLDSDAPFYAEFSDNLVRNQFRTHISDATNTRRWASEAKEASLQWTGWHPSSYAAFCRNFGDHSTPKAGYHNWNEEALKAMSEDLEQPWENLQSALDEESERMSESFDAAFKSALKCLDILAKYPAASKALRGILKSRGGIASSTFQDLWHAFANSSMETLRIDGLSGIRTSIFGRSMEASYQACNRDYGSGVDRRRKHIIESAMGSQATFRTHMHEFRRQFVQLVQEFEKKLHKMADEQLGEINALLGMVRGENVVAETEGDREFRQMVKDVVADVVLEMPTDVD